MSITRTIGTHTMLSLQWLFVIRTNGLSLLQEGRALYSKQLRMAGRGRSRCRRNRLVKIIISKATYRGLTGLNATYNTSPLPYSTNILEKKCSIPAPEGRRNKAQRTIKALQYQHKVVKTRKRNLRRRISITCNTQLNINLNLNTQ